MNDPYAKPGKPPVFDASIMQKTKHGDTELLTIDLNSFGYMNSDMIRNMMRWFQDVQEDYPLMHIHLKNVHPNVVRALLAIRSYLPRLLEVTSTFVPYFCEACSNEAHSRHVTKEMLAVPGAVESVTLQPPPCPVCNVAMEADFNSLYLSLFNLPEVKK